MTDALQIVGAAPGGTSEASCSSFRREVESAINRHSMENGSNTPDFILAMYLVECLAAFDRAVNARDAWYSIAPCPGWSGPNAELSGKESRKEDGLL
jgi:hypothetical protein